MPLNNLQRSEIKRQINYAILGPDDPLQKTILFLAGKQEVLESAKLLIKILKELKENIALSTRDAATAGLIKKELLEKYQKDLPELARMRVEKICDEMITWLCFSENNQHILKKLGGDFTKKEAEECVDEALTDALNSSIPTLLNNFPKHPPRLPTSNILQESTFTFSLAALKLYVLNKEEKKISADIFSNLGTALSFEKYKIAFIYDLAKDSNEPHYFDFIRESPLWPKLGFDTARLAKEYWPSFIVFLKEAIYQKDIAKTLTQSQFYEAIYRQLQKFDKLISTPRNAADNISPIHIDFIQKYLLNTASFFLHDAKQKNDALSLTRGRECLCVAKKIFGSDTADRFIKLLETMQRQLIDIVTNKLEEQKQIATEKSNELKLEADLEQKEQQERWKKTTTVLQQQKIAKEAIKWEEKLRTLKEEDEEQVMRKKIHPQIQPAIAPLTPEQTRLQEIEILLQKKQYDLAKEKLESLDDKFFAASDKERFLTAKAEIDLRLAAKLLKTIRLFAHIESSPATPVSAEEHESIKTIQQLLSMAQKSCEQIKTDKISEQGVIAADILHKKANHTRQTLNQHIVKFYQYCAYRKAMIVAAGNYGHSNSGFANAMQDLTPTIAESVSQEIERLRKSNPATEEDKDIRPYIENDIQSILFGFIQHGFTVIVFGGFNRDKLAEEEFRDIDLIAMGPKNPETFLRQCFGQGKFLENPHRKNHYQVFLGKRKYDIAFQPPQSDILQLQVNLAKNADCPANSLSFTVQSDGCNGYIFSKLYDHTGLGITDAKNKIIDASHAAELIENDAFIPLRYLDLASNKGFISSYFFMSDENRRQLGKNLLKRCQDKQEFGRLQSALTKILFHGHAKKAFKLLVKYGIIQQFFPERLNFIRQNTKIFFDNLNSKDKEAASNKKILASALNDLLGSLPKDPPRQPSPLIQLNQFRPVNNMTITANNMTTEQQAALRFIRPGFHKH